MKTGLLCCLLICASLFTANAQEEATTLPHFNKIIVSPRISLILIKGDKESIRLVCNNIAREKVNIRVHGTRLHVFLDHARVIEKQVRIGNASWKHGIYSDVTVTAFVTYKDIKELEIRGESEISADDNLTTDKLKLRVFGQCEVNLASINVRKFKASLYGKSRLTIREGLANRQVYRIFGETKIDTKGLVCATASVRMFGEGTVKMNATDEVYLTAFGEPRLALSGTALLSKLVVGEASISRMK